MLQVRIILEMRVSDFGSESLCGPLIHEKEILSGVVGHRQPRVGQGILTDI